MDAILQKCLSLDQHAVQIYWHLHKNTVDPTLKVFWLHMRYEEATHVRFWKRMLDLAERGYIADLFDTPQEIVEFLGGIEKKILTVAERITNLSDTREQILCAYRLEFFLINPVITKIFSFANSLPLEFEVNTMSLYEDHLSLFLKTLKPFNPQYDEFDLLSETITTLFIREKELTHDVLFDQLTGLMNRRSFFAITKPMAFLAQRKDFDVAILMADIDNFKKINDTYGHLHGDMILKITGEVIRDRMRQSDIASRFGGEEFIIFFSQTDPAFLVEIAKTIQLNLWERTINTVGVTLSIGIASGKLSMPVDLSLLYMIKTADERLYKVKNSGKNAICIA